METIKKLMMLILSMILVISCKSPLGDEDEDGGIEGFPSWYLTEQQQQQNFSMGPTIIFDTKRNDGDPKQLGDQQYRIPAIIVASNGNIIAIADNRYNKGSDIGNGKDLIDVVYKVSKDGGKTWSEEKIIPPKSPSAAMTGIDNKGDALVFLHPDGTLICMATSGGGYAGVSGDTTRSRMVRSVSTDNGETWSAWQEVGKSLIDTINTKHGMPRAFASSGRGLTLKDGTLTAGMTAGNSANQFVFVYAYSKDKGMTWNYGGSIENAGGHGTINEPKIIAELDNGNLLASVRNASGSGGNATTITQTKNRMYAIFGPNGENMPVSLSAWSFKCGNIDAEGVVWTRANEQDKTRILHIQGGPNYRRGLRLYISEDQGLTFPKYYLITEDSFADTDKVAYSSLDVAGDGTVVTLAEEYSPNGMYYDIVFRRYNMKTITGEVYQTSWYK